MRAIRHEQLRPGDLAARAGKREHPYRALEEASAAVDRIELQRRLAGPPC
jgi:hypothetical protein